MKRNFLFAWYQTPRGRLLQQLEADYLQHAIQVGCKQTIIQIGGLGWENEFIDCQLYERLVILDDKNIGTDAALKIQGKAYSLPIQTASVDLVLIPHLLEFDAHRFQTIREVERILKPEGSVIIINFNPWNFWVRYQFIWQIKWSDSWHAHLLRSSRVIDWLKLLNFEIKTDVEFDVNEVYSRNQKLKPSLNPLLATAYAVKAIKRRYTLIPLQPSVLAPMRLAPVANLEASNKVHE